MENNPKDATETKRKINPKVLLRVAPWEDYDIGAEIERYRQLEQENLSLTPSSENKVMLRLQSRRTSMVTVPSLQQLQEDGNRKASWTEAIRTICRRLKWKNKGFCYKA